MNPPASAFTVSRRAFVHAASVLGAATLVRPDASAAEKNPFAYDVSRLAKTDPALLTWTEVSRRTCAVPHARRLALGPDDAVYLAADNQIVRWAASGERPGPDLGTAVRCLAVASDGTLFAGLRDRLAVFAANGQRRADWPSPGKRSWFTGLAVSDRDVFIADSGERVIWRFDRAGKLLGRIGHRDTARGVPGLVLPSPFLDVRLAADGLLRVNDPGRHRIEVYTTDGDLELAWGEPSAAIHGFCGCCNPIGLALLPDGRTVTCEKGLPRVKVYHADGALESVVAGPETFAENARPGAATADGPRGGLDAAVDSRGRIHVLDRVTGDVRVFQPKARA